MDNHFNVVAEVVMDGSLGSDGDVSGDDHGGGRHGHRRKGDVGMGGRRGNTVLPCHISLRRDQNPQQKNDGFHCEMSLKCSALFALKYVPYLYRSLCLFIDIIKGVHCESLIYFHK